MEEPKFSAPDDLSVTVAPYGAELLVSVAANINPDGSERVQFHARVPRAVGFDVRALEHAALERLWAWLQARRSRHSAG